MSHVVLRHRDIPDLDKLEVKSPRGAVRLERMRSDGTGPPVSSAKIRRASATGSLARQFVGASSPAAIQPRARAVARNLPSG